MNLTTVPYEDETDRRHDDRRVWVIVLPPEWLKRLIKKIVRLLDRGA